MFRNYVTSAFRALRKHRLYSFINIGGLAVGLTAFFLIGLFVRHERSFDQFHENGDRIFRVVQEQPGNMYLGSNHFAVTPKPLVTALVDEVPGVEAATQLTELSALLRIGETGYLEEGIMATNPFFDMFTFPLLQGSANGLLSEPDHIVVSESLARKLYGRTDVVGEQLEFVYYDDPLMLTVQAVMADVPSNSQLQFDYVVSFLASESWVASSRWGNNSYTTYGLTSAPMSAQLLDERVDAMAKAHMAELSWIKDSPERMPRFYTQKLTDIHLHSRINFDMALVGDIRYIWLFSGVALLILITACINYMNLATARAGVRAREVGIRKVAGADRRQLIGQFIGEAVATSMTALVAAAALTALILPAVNSVFERDIRVTELISAGPILFMILTALVVGVVSGSWPAFKMSAMRPAIILKGSGTGRRHSFLRNALVVSQFAMGIVLVLGVLVIQRQMDFISSTDTGVQRDQLVAIRVQNNELRRNADSLVERMASIPGVSGVTRSSHLPIRITSNSGVSDWEGAPADASFHLWNTRVGEHFEELSGLTFVAGNGFSKDRVTDLEEGLVVNESAIRALGWDVESAVGRTLEFQGRSRILGVVQDFHFQSLHETIAPMALLFDESRTTYVILRVDSGNMQPVMAEIGERWKEFAEGYPLNSEFLDDAFRKQYETEFRLAAILRMFTLLALFVAGLGLFGLAAYTAQQRTREIGIRKVLGASPSSVVFLLSAEFGKLVFIAFILGAPLAWLGMNQWLEAFAYRTSIGAGTLLAVGGVCLALALASVGFQAVRAALLDPVKSLRYDG